MPLTSYTFLFIFLPLAVLINLATHGKYKTSLLAILNLIFISYLGLVPLLIIIISMLTYFYAASILHKNPNKVLFITTISVNILVLVFFKYKPLFIATTNLTFLEGIMAPLGISFYTFQGIAYLADVTYRNRKPETDLLKFSAFFMLFMTITSGPILRYDETKIDDPAVSSDMLYNGFTRFTIGLFKKAYLAANFGLIASKVYKGLYITAFFTGTAWLGSIAFMLQLYLDFSGYTDMALGIGEMLGINLPENFNFPYLATSFSDFWKRWHITLTRWFKDYIYIPLGGNRKGPTRTYLNMLIVWLITGFWHGSSLNFIIWGCFNFLIIILERNVWGDTLKKTPRVIQHLVTLLLINIGWVFFRASSLEQAFDFISKMFIWDMNQIGVKQILTYVLSRPLDWVLAILFCTPIVSTFFTRWSESEIKWQQIASMILIVGLFILGIIFVITSSFKAFIYQQF
ncbi:MBOAT family protein [Erysipelothrix piscisicarius]|uniref:MBOAT family protein n=1 Tax=Erysipelothrix piscisicarius TaxID=2485784 RepID=A0A3Q8S364_9FIRM|nr:MBOAT family O-acyltransferase [Erysipelothrix piscisicarius]AZK44656.1 MBOAT family protein [Erysipelothrix piscisicarius]